MDANHQMKMTTRSLSLARAVYFASIVSVAVSFSGVALGASSEAVTLSFIHLNDLHAHLTSHLDSVPDGPPGEPANHTKIVRRGGLARFATLIKRIRADNPNSVLMNVGDTYHGGVEALFTNGNAIVDPVNALGIDVGVPGNWDFAYGPIVTRRRYTDLPITKIMEAMQGPRQRMARWRGRLRGDNERNTDTPEQQQLHFMTPFGPVKQPNFPNLAANVTLTMPPMRRGQTLLAPTLMKTIGGIPVGFIGITSDIVPRMHPMLALGMSFLEGEDNYRALVERYARELRRQGAQVVVVMSELGIHKDYRLAQIITPASVDIFFSAHTHEAVFTPLTSASGALVVESGNDGYLGRMDVTVRGGKVIERRWKLLIVGDDIPEDAAMRKLVERARAPFLARTVNMQPPMPMINLKLTQPIDSVVGHTLGPLDRHHALESTFNDAMADILRRLAGTQVAMTPGFRFDVAVVGRPEDNTLVSGDITIEDLYRFFPAPYNIAVADVSGRRLREVMEDGLRYVFSPDVFQQSGGWFEGYSGLRAELDLAKPDGHRIQQLWLKDSKQPLSGDKVVTIAGCTRPFEAAGTLCSYSGFDNVRPLINPDTGEAWTPVDVFRHALAQGPLAGETRRDMSDLNQTPLWPAADFVQPLRGVAASANAAPRR